jgi:hypothetical protein
MDKPSSKFPAQENVSNLANEIFEFCDVQQQNECINLFQNTIIQLRKNQIDLLEKEATELRDANSCYNESRVKSGY